MQVVRAGGRRWIGWTPQLMGFWATAIQLVGTLFFNVTTFAALASLTRRRPASTSGARTRSGRSASWSSSAIAFAEAGHRWFSWRPGKRDWHITALNMWGSVFFGISAIGAYVDPDGQMVSAEVGQRRDVPGGAVLPGRLDPDDARGPEPGPRPRLNLVAARAAPRRVGLIGAPPLVGPDDRSSPTR